MKMITAIINKDDSKAVNKQLIKAGYRVTRFATTGGFLLSGNTTMMIVLEDDKVDDCIKIIAEFSGKRDEIMPNMPSSQYSMGSGYDGLDALAMASIDPLHVEIGGATIMVTNVERFEKL